jgi:hypothetical protein
MKDVTVAIYQSTNLKLTDLNHQDPQNSSYPFQYSKRMPIYIVTRYLRSQPIQRHVAR